MKNYEEMAKLVLEARDEYVKKKKNRVLFLKRASVVTFGAAVVLGIGLFTHAMKPPKKPNTGDSNIIYTPTESIYTSNVNPILTTISSATTNQQLSLTTSVNTNKSAEKGEITTNKLKPEPQSTYRTSVVDERIETKTIISTSIVITTKAGNTSMHVTTSNETYETTVTTGSSGISFGEDDYYLKHRENKYHILNTRVNENLVNTFSAEKVSVHIQQDDEPFDVDIFMIDELSPDFVMAIRENNTTYRLCRNYCYTPNSLLELIEDIGLMKYWKTDIEYEDCLDAVFLLENADIDLYASPGKAVSSFPVYSVDFEINDASIELTEKGYLTFNLSGYTYVFNIGYEQLNNYLSLIKLGGD